MDQEIALQEFPDGLAAKDLALSLQWLGWLLWHRSDPWPGNFCMLWSWPKKKREKGVPIAVQWKQTRLVSTRMHVQSLALLSGLRICHCHELWCRLQTQLRSQLLWLWPRLAAVALIQLLAWEFLCAVCVALKSKIKYF